jgi:hypothetical protein
VESRNEAEELRDRLVEAYRTYLVAMVESRGVPLDAPVEAAIDRGTAWLAGALHDLLSRPFREQGRGPMELFQEAMRFPTEALAASGLEPPERDPGQVSALPGDLYGLAPASSQELGDEAWRAHLAWGAAKARAMRPAVGLLSADLIDRSKVEAAAGGGGFRLVVWRRRAAVDLRQERPAVVFVDLAHDDADAVIRDLASSGVRVVGYGPHVDDLALVRARALGAADALPRSAFFRSLEGLLPTVT